MQGLILVVATAIVLGAGVPVPAAVVQVVLPMELFAVMGAAWGHRLKTKIETRTRRGNRPPPL